MSLDPNSYNTIFLYLFGMWGKTGINCFLMITGYFMCTSKISMRKFVKLMLWIYLYKIIIYGIFLATGYETLGLPTIKLLIPGWGFYTNFTGCFIVFWLTIPFWNILIKNMSKRQHEALLCLLLGMYTFLGSIPSFNVSLNYVTWFGVIYLIASYIRLYPIDIYSNKKVWATLSILTILLGSASILTLHHYTGHHESIFVSDSNKIFAVAIAITTFLWFKNINIPYSNLLMRLEAPPLEFSLSMQIQMLCANGFGKTLWIVLVTTVFHSGNQSASPQELYSQYSLHAL